LWKESVPDNSGNVKIFSFFWKAQERMVFIVVITLRVMMTVRLHLGRLEHLSRNGFLQAG
jgi:hypothetical protein